MKKKIVFLIFLLVFFSFLSGLIIWLLRPKNQTGQLKITSSPPATVFINNVAIGKTPFRQENKKPGEYIVKLIPEGPATSTASFTTKVKISSYGITYLNAELGFSELSTSAELLYPVEIKTSKGDTGEVYVETDPIGAIVSLDNDEKGPSPLILENVPQGIHEISVFLPGFFKRTQKILVEKNVRINSFFKLAIDPNQQTNLTTPTPQATSSAIIKKFVLIKNNPLGWLRVRTEASLNSSEAAKVKVGEKYEFIEEKNDWYKIKYNGNKEGLIEGSFDTGWVSKNYTSLEQ